MRIGVVGYSSKLGKGLIQRGCIALDCDDVTKINSIERVLAHEKPDIVVNLASRSSPDWCERNFEGAYDININGTLNMCKATSDRKIALVLMSTDHIFSGKTFFDWKLKRLVKRGPYKENYPRAIPVNNYGLTKLGMEAVAAAYDNTKVVRTSYCFNKERLEQDMYELDTSYAPIPFPTFIKRSFMHIEHFTESFMEYLDKFFEMPKTLNISGSEVVSWYDFVIDLADTFGYDKRCIVPKTRNDISFAPRPHKAGLDVSLSAKLGLPQFSYLDGLRYMKGNE